MKINYDSGTVLGTDKLRIGNVIRPKNIMSEIHRLIRKLDKKLINLPSKYCQTN